MTGLPAPIPELLVAAANGSLPELLDSAKARCLELPQAECPLRHHFSPGLYIREVTIPAGTFAMGRVHKAPQLNIMLSGRVTVLNADGSTSELRAPQMFIGAPGRKVGYAHEDTTWLNVWATNETDVAKIEREVLEDDEDLAQAQRLALPAPRTEDQEDYAALLSELGLTEDQVQADMAQAGDLCPLPPGSYKFSLGDSSISGRGVFCTHAIAAGELIGPARIGAGKTVLGRYTNHAACPTAEPVLNGARVDLVARVGLQGQRGGVPGDEITIDYRQALSIARRLQELAA